MTEGPFALDQTEVVLVALHGEGLADGSVDPKTLRRFGKGLVICAARQDRPSHKDQLAHVRKKNLTVNCLATGVVSQFTLITKDNRGEEHRVFVVGLPVSTQDPYDSAAEIRGRRVGEGDGLTESEAFKNGEWFRHLVAVRLRVVRDEGTPAA